MPRLLVGQLVAVMFIFLTTGMSDPKPTISKAPLTADEVQIYRVVLDSYVAGEKSSWALNIANVTDPLDGAEAKAGGCFRGLELDGSKIDDAATIVHHIDTNSFPGRNVRVVDPREQLKTVEKNDPQTTIFKEGKPVDAAVKGAFETGLFSFSEIVFDKSHAHAVVSYGFYCGGLCGHGRTLVLEKNKDGWKIKNRECSGWIS